MQFGFMIYQSYEGRQMIEHTKKLVEDRFTIFRGYEYNPRDIVHSCSFEVTLIHLKNRKTLQKYKSIM